MRDIYLILLILFIISGCKERFSPKPNGYLRIDLTEKEDTLFKPIDCPFEFYAPNYFQIDYQNNKNCWIDLTFLKHQATIHLTYKKITNNLVDLFEESRQMTYKHTVKADAINEKKYLNQNHNTYGTLYDVHGQTASSVQFYLTDSTKHFLRGALYFQVNPNQDSLKPIVNYLRNDIMKIMETLQWKDSIVSVK